MWASSMNRMIGCRLRLTSSITALRRFSNSPLTPAPACNRPRSRVCRATSLSTAGTSPWAMRSARPSTTAVLPTPASPVRIGLFCRRRVRMSTICRTSNSRPSTGSMRPSRALWVRLTVYWSSAGVLPLALLDVLTGAAGLASGLACLDSALPSTSAARFTRRSSALIFSSSGAEAITTRRSSASSSRACSR
ncbi:hypothetical protein D3C76_1254350 [compost metagenome]